MSTLSNKATLFFCSLPLLFLFVFFIIKSTTLGYSDFASYYFGNQLLLSGNYTAAYHTASLNQYIASLGFHNLFVSYTPFPPFTSIFLAPINLLPIGISKIIFNIFSCLFFLYTLNRAFIYFSLNPLLLLCVPIIFYTPLRSNVYFGQSYLILFCLLLEGYMAYEKKQTLLSSLLWGIAIVFKIFPVLIFFYLLLKKEYKTMSYLTGACTLFLLSSILINGFSSWHFYLSELFPRLNNGELNDSFTYIFQSAFMLLKNIFIYDEISNPHAILSNLYLFCFFLVLFKTLIIGSSVLTTLTKGLSNILSFSAWILASLLISPNGSTYSQILLLIPLIALLNSSLRTSTKIISAFLILLISNIPVHFFANLPLLLKFPRLYLLIGFFLLIIIVSKTKFNYKIIIGCFILCSVLEFPRLLKTQDNSSCFGKNHEHLLVYDYAIKSDLIVRHYWSECGAQQDTVYCKINNHSTNDLTIKENQIYFKGDKITQTSDWKQKPTLINEEQIIYLSDKNRGVGFYTLRKIKLPLKNGEKSVIL